MPQRTKPAFNDEGNAIESTDVNSRGGSFVSLADDVTTEVN